MGLKKWKVGEEMPDWIVEAFKHKMLIEYQRPTGKTILFRTRSGWFEVLDCVYCDGQALFIELVPFIKCRRKMLIYPEEWVEKYVEGGVLDNEL